MNVYKLYNNNEYVNTIVCSSDDIESIALLHGYTYELEIKNTNTPLSPLEQLQQENKLLKAQLQAQTDRSDFIEECIAEMAGVVYNTEETTT